MQLVTVLEALVTDGVYIQELLQIVVLFFEKTQNILFLIVLKRRKW
jgi:hypothetical protein